MILWPFGTNYLRTIQLEVVKTDNHGLHMHFLENFRCRLFKIFKIPTMFRENASTNILQVALESLSNIWRILSMYLSVTDVLERLFFWSFLFESTKSIFNLYKVSVKFFFHCYTTCVITNVGFLLYRHFLAMVIKQLLQWAAHKSLLWSLKNSICIINDINV